MKIFFIVPQITHYRISFYEKLIQQNSQHEWLVIDGEKNYDDGRPCLNIEFKFPNKRFLEKTKKIGPFSLRDYVGLLDFIKDQKPDLIICPAISGTKVYRSIAKLARQEKLKLILWSCLWEHYNVLNSRLRILKNIINKKYFNSACFHLAYSSFAKKKLIKYKFPADKILIAYNGIETDQLEIEKIDNIENCKLKAELNIEPITKLLLYVGGLGSDKNVLLLLKALVALEEKNISIPYVLVIIGDGPEKEKLMTFVFDHNLAKIVLFLGRIVSHVNKYFQICDYYILPGAGGLGMNQAMYWEKPCIVAHADGTEEDLIFNKVTGFRFEENNFSSLSDTIKMALEYPTKDLNIIGEKAKQIIIEKSNVNSMITVFNSVIKKVNNEIH